MWGSPGNMYKTDKTKGLWWRNAVTAGEIYKEIQLGRKSSQDQKCAPSRANGPGVKPGQPQFLGM